MGKLKSLFPFKRRTEKKAEEKKQKVVFVSVRFLFLSFFQRKKQKKRSLGPRFLSDHQRITSRSSHRGSNKASKTEQTSFLFTTHRLKARIYTHTRTHTYTHAYQ